MHTVVGTYIAKKRAQSCMSLDNIVLVQRNGAAHLFCDVHTPATAECVAGAIQSKLAGQAGKAAASAVTTELTFIQGVSLHSCLSDTFLGTFADNLTSGSWPFINQLRGFVKDQTHGEASLGLLHTRILHQHSSL